MCLNLYSHSHKKLELISFIELHVFLWLHNYNFIELTYTYEHKKCLQFPSEADLIT